MYTDKDYSWNTHIRCASHGPSNLTPLQHHYNWIMSKERIGIEWGNGKIKISCPLTLQKKLLKLQQVDVVQLIRVAVLLTNAHTCLHQS